jgi:hypothetical protein
VEVAATILRLAAKVKILRKPQQSFLFKKNFTIEPLAKIIRITGRHKATARPWES